MSKRNRDRRRWRCHGCGTGMHRELDRQAPAGIDPRVVHVCGLCKTCHYAEGGRLRLLTPAEVFALHVELPRTMDIIAGLVLAPSETPDGVFLLAFPEKQP